MQHSRKKRAWRSPSRLVKVVASLVVGVTVALASPLAASAAETPWDVAHEDIRHFAINTLQHRVLLNYDGLAEEVSVPDLVRAILRELPEESRAPAPKLVPAEAT